MAHKFDKYRFERIHLGKMNLTNPVWENIVHLAACSTPDDEICSLVGCTQKDIEDCLADPVAQKRLAHKRKVRARDAADRKPKSGEELLLYVKRRLDTLSRKASKDSEKIRALEVLGKMGREEMASKPSGGDATGEDVEALKKAFGGSG